MSAYCPECGRTVEFGWKHCYFCGHGLPQECGNVAEIAAVEGDKSADSAAARDEGLGRLPEQRVAESFETDPSLSPPPNRSYEQFRSEGWVNSPAPWRRFIARELDYMIYALCLGAVAIAFEVDLGHGSSFVVGAIVIALWVPVEAILIQSVGTTPGKWLLNIRVRQHGGNRLSFQTSLWRSVLVWGRGVCFGIPIATRIANWIAWDYLTKNLNSSWDQECNSYVSHRGLSPLRWTLATLTILVLLVLISFGASMRN